MIRYDAAVGDFRNLYTSGSGKAVLSKLPESERTKVVSKLKLTAQTPNTITSKAALLEDIRLGIDRGWFLANGEGVIDVMSIARPIEIGKSVYSVPIVGPVHRMAPTMTQLAVKLVTCCERINAIFKRK